MKSIFEVKKPAKKPHKYPYLGIFPDGAIVLFTGVNEGFLIHSPKNQMLHYSDCWKEPTAEPIRGRVILSND